jgi:hypothetical protein
MRYCQKHPKVETALSCSRCETPICPKCMISAPVGYLCPTCASVGKDPLFLIPLWRMGLAIFVGLVAGTLLGLLLQQIGFYIIFAGTIIGGLFGQLVLWTTGGKRGHRVEWIAGGSIVIGAGISLLVDGEFDRYIRNPTSGVIFLFAVVVTAGAAIARLRRW